MFRELLTILFGIAVLWMGNGLRDDFWKCVREERSYTPLAHQQWLFFYALLSTLFYSVSALCFLLAGQSLLGYIK